MSGKKGMIRYSEEIKEQVRKEVQAGQSQRKISRRYGISRYTIQSWCGLRPETKLRQVGPLRRGRPGKIKTIPADVAVVERQQRNLLQSQDNSACHEEIRPAGRDPTPQEMAAGTQIPKSSQPRFSCPSTKLQMGDGYFLHSDGARCVVPVYDPGFV